MHGPGGRGPALAAALVALLVVTAGCSSVLGGDATRTPFGVPDGTDGPGDATTATADTTAGTTTTRTTSTRPGSDPVDVGADDGPLPELETGELAPGLTPEAVTDPERLAAAHRRVLANRSFRVRHRRAFGTPDTPLSETVVAAVSTDRRRFSVERTVVVPDDGGRGTTTTEFWSNETETLRLISFGETRTFGRLAPNRSLSSVPDVDDPVHGSLVAWAFDATVVLEVRDVPSAVAPAQYRVLATGERNRSTAPDGTPVRDLRLEAVVDSRGVVRQLQLQYERRTGEGWVEVDVFLSVTGIGTTEPRPPTWRSDALEAFNGTDPIGGRVLPADRGATPLPKVDPGRTR